MSSGQRITENQSVDRVVNSESIVTKTPLTRDQANEKVRLNYAAHTNPSSCMACENEKTRNFMWRRGFRMAECPNCGFIWVDPIPSGGDMASFYNDRVFKPYPPEVVQRKFIPELNVIKKVVAPGSHILDVGCGHGHFAALLRDAGYEVSGADIDANTLDYANKHYGIPVHCGELQQLSFDQKFDAVTLLSSLEHMVEPLSALEAAARILRPNGVLIISTPRGDGLIPALSRKVFMNAIGNWEFISPPSHLTYFGKPSIKAMMKRAGFESVDIHDRDRDAIYKKRELIETLEESTDVPAWAKSLYPKLYCLRPLARMVNAGDMMICVAHKGDK